MAGIIGIKVANGDFYPIVGENSTVKKRLVLTTVHDNQDSVQIDLFRSISKSMLDAQYIGSLVVEDIRSCLKGEPSIEMLISASQDGNITAEAYDLDASPDSDHHILNVSLKTMDTFTKPDDFPDFEMDNDEPQVAASYSKPHQKSEKERKFPWGIMVAATLCVILVIAALWFFLIRDRGGRPIAYASPGYTEQVAQPPPVAVEPPPQPPPPQPAAQPVQPPPPPPPVETVAVPVIPPPAPVEVSPPVIQAPVAPPPEPAQVVHRQRPPAPVLSHRVPAVIPPNGVVYQIRWGDTLWDIAAAFYRNPLLYPRIARHNNIRDPNFILAGFNVRIPPLN